MLRELFSAAVAARTKKIRISQGIAIAPFYHPVRLAEDMAVLDILSSGRVELALGVGYLVNEAKAYGSDFKGRGRYSDELLEIVSRLWRGETVDFNGEFFTLQKARISPLPVQKPGIPLLIGGLAPPGLRRAARYDGYIGGVELYPAYLDALKACGKNEKAARLDSLSDMWFVVSEDPEQTMNEVAPHFGYQINAYAKLQADLDWGFEEMDVETLKKSGAITVLTPEQAIAHIHARIETAPAMESFCMLVPAGLSFSKLAEHAELFANKVMPAFR